MLSGFLSRFALEKIVTAALNFGPMDLEMMAQAHYNDANPPIYFPLSSDTKSIDCCMCSITMGPVEFCG